MCCVTSYSILHMPDKKITFYAKLFLNLYINQNPLNKSEKKEDVFDFFMYFIQHCFICRPSISNVSEDAGIEPRTVAT